MNCRSASTQTVDVSPLRPDESSSLNRPTHTPGRKPSETAFSLVELLIVVTVIGILAAIATPMFLAARQSAVEKAVVSNLRTMASNQQLFFLSPILIPPFSKTDDGKRFARLHELNSFSANVFGTTTATFYIDAPGVRYSMVPLWPSTAELRGQFVIEAAQQNADGGFIYQVDESGRIVKIR